MLRKIRIAAALILFCSITFLFLDFAQVLPTHWVAVITKIQFAPALLALSVFVLVPLLLTLILGRIYCSTICPLGVFQDIMNFLSRKIGKRKRYGFRPNHPILRWSIVVVVVIAWLCGLTFVVGLVEPYSAYGRIASGLFRPVYLFFNNILANVLMSHGHYSLYYMDLSIRTVAAFVVALLTFLVIAVLSYGWGRLYCNNICPVGTILGYLSKFSLFRIKINTEKCNHCLACGRKCKCFCMDSPNQKIDFTRCVVCFDCIGNCHQHAIGFGLRPFGKKSDIKKSVDSAPEGSESTEKNAAAGEACDPSRRQFISASVATAVALPICLTADVQPLVAKVTGSKSYTRTPLLPPGAGSRDNMLSHCTSCHLCVSKCPSHVIKPAFLEYGVAGMLQPTVSFEKGFCNYDCTLCSEVCPTGAIKLLTKDLKQKTQIGHAVFIEENCIVNRHHTDCGACAEHCPTQAVSMQPYKDGLSIPHVDASICVGCGGCEFACPAKPFKAIHIEGHLSQTQRAEFKETKQSVQQVDSFGF